MPPHAPRWPLTGLQSQCVPARAHRPAGPVRPSPRPPAAHTPPTACGGVGVGASERPGRSVTTRSTCEGVGLAQGSAGLVGTGSGHSWSCLFWYSTLLARKGMRLEKSVGRWGCQRTQCGYRVGDLVEVHVKVRGARSGAVFTVYSCTLFTLYTPAAGERHLSGTVSHGPSVPRSRYRFVSNTRAVRPAWACPRRGRTTEHVHHS